MRKLLSVISVGGLIFLGGGCVSATSQQSTNKAVLPAGFSKYVSSNLGVEVQYATFVTFPYNIKKNVLIKEVASSKLLDPAKIVLFPEGDPKNTVDFLIWKQPADISIETFITSLINNKSCKLSDPAESDPVMYSIANGQSCGQLRSWKVYSDGLVIEAVGHQDPFIYGKDVMIKPTM